jgi:hypothetical protein
LEETLFVEETDLEEVFAVVETGLDKASAVNG